MHTKQKITQSTKKFVTFKEDIFNQFLQSNACPKNIMWNRNYQVYNGN